MQSGMDAIAFLGDKIMKRHKGFGIAAVGMVIGLALTAFAVLSPAETTCASEGPACFESPTPKATEMASETPQPTATTQPSATVEASATPQPEATKTTEPTVTVLPTQTETSVPTDMPPTATTVVISTIEATVVPTETPGVTVTASPTTPPATVTATPTAPNTVTPTIPPITETQPPSTRTPEPQAPENPEPVQPSEPPVVQTDEPEDALGETGPAERDYTSQLEQIGTFTFFVNGVRRVEPVYRGEVREGKLLLPSRGFVLYGGRLLGHEAQIMGSTKPDKGSAAKLNVPGYNRDYVFGGSNFIRGFQPIKSLPDSPNVSSLVTCWSENGEYVGNVFISMVESEKEYGGKI